MNKGLEKYTELVKEAKRLGGPENLRRHYYSKGYCYGQKVLTNFARIIANKTKIINK